MRKRYEELLRTINNNMKKILHQLEYLRKAVIAIPTGAGKGYLMRIDILRRFLGNENIIAVLSHRLMLNTQHTDDIMRDLCIEADKFAIINIGTNTNQMKEPDYYNSLTPFNEFYRGLLNADELKTVVDDAISKGKKVLIVCTYHSSGLIEDAGITLDTLYCDEVHRLANTEITNFIENYLRIKATNRFHTTATPKILSTENEVEHYMMNNVDIFGEELYMPIRECIDKRMICEPIITMERPFDFDEEDDHENLTNKYKVIIETIRDVESNVALQGLGPKLMVKCVNIEELMVLARMLRNNGEYNIAYLSAEHGSYLFGNSFGVYFEDPINVSRGEFIKRINALPDTENLIILHYDILTEGINISGLNSVLFLSSSLTIAPLLQNIGRATRLHPEDRKRINEAVRNGIDPEEIELLKKKYCYIYMPYLNRKQKGEVSRNTRKLIIALHDLDIARDIRGYEDILTGRGIHKSKRETGNDIYLGEELEEIEKVRVDTLEEFIKLEEERLRREEAKRVFNEVENRFGDL